MTSDLEDGEIEDFESGCSPESLRADRTLQFVYTGDDAHQTQPAKEHHRSSSPYSPSGRLSPLQLDLPQGENESLMEGRQTNRLVGGYWAPLSSAVKKEAGSSSDLSEENADGIFISPTSDANFDSLLKKYRDIRQEIDEVEREEEQKVRFGTKVARIERKASAVPVKEGDEDELAEMQLRLAALESTLQRTQTRTADCLQRGELELNRNEVEDGELIDDDGELEQIAEEDELVGGENQNGREANSSKSASQLNSRAASERRGTASRKILSPRRDKVARQSSSRRSSASRSKASERRRSSHDRESSRQSSSRSERKRRRRSDSGDRRVVAKRERLNKWQQLQREKILSTQDPNAQMKEFYRMLTTTSFNMTTTTASSSALESSRRSMSRDATALYSSSSMSTARADSVHDNYDSLSMELASDNEQRSPEEDVFPEVPPPPGVSPPALDLLVRDAFGISRRSIEQPSPPPRPPSDEPVGDEDDDDDDDAEALRQSLLAQVQKKRKDSPPPDALSKKAIDDGKTSKTATEDTRIVIAPNSEKVSGAAPSRVPIRSSERSIQYGPNLVRTISNTERHVIGTDGQLKVTMPVARFGLPTVSELDARGSSEQNQPPVDQLLNQMLKDTRKRTDQVKANRQQQQQMPANFAALEERLKSCEADVEGHRDRVQEDRNRLRSLQALKGRYSLERRKAASYHKRLLDQLAVVRADLYKREKALVQLDPEIKMVEARLATKEKMLADFERQWNEIQALQAFVAKRKGIPLQEQQQQQQATTTESSLRTRKEQLQAVKKQTEARMTRLNPVRAATVVEQDSVQPGDSLVQNPLMTFGGNRVSPLFPPHLLTSVTFSNQLNCHVPLCPFALSGRCADETCPWQHDHDYQLSDQQLVASVVADAPWLLSENESCLDFAARVLKERRPSQPMDAFLRALLDKVPDEQRAICFETSVVTSSNQNALSTPEVEVPFYRVPVLSSQLTRRYFTKKMSNGVGQ